MGDNRKPSIARTGFAGEGIFNRLDVRIKQSNREESAGRHDKADDCAVIGSFRMVPGSRGTLEDEGVVANAPILAGISNIPPG